MAAGRPIIFLSNFLSVPQQEDKLENILRVYEELSSDVRDYCKIDGAHSSRPDGSSGGRDMVTPNVETRDPEEVRSLLLDSGMWEETIHTCTGRAASLFDEIDDIFQWATWQMRTNAIFFQTAIAGTLQRTSSTSGFWKLSSDNLQYIADFLGLQTTGGGKFSSFVRGIRALDEKWIACMESPGEESRLQHRRGRPRSRSDSNHDRGPSFYIRRLPRSASDDLLKEGQHVITWSSKHEFERESDAKPACFVARRGRIRDVNYDGSFDVVDDWTKKVRFGVSRNEVQLVAKYMNAPPPEASDAVSPHTMERTRPFNGPSFISCANCEASYPLFRCSKCKLVGYCSGSCQTRHWSTHRKMCGSFSWGQTLHPMTGETIWRNIASGETTFIRPTKKCMQPWRRSTSVYSIVKPRSGGPLLNWGMELRAAPAEPSILSHLEAEMAEVTEIEETIEPRISLSLSATPDRLRIPTIRNVEFIPLARTRSHVSNTLHSVSEVLDYATVERQPTNLTDAAADKQVASSHRTTLRSQQVAKLRSQRKSASSKKSMLRNPKTPRPKHSRNVNFTCRGSNGKGKGGAASNRPRRGRK